VFPYFGSKSKSVHLYPAPIYDQIIKPFAGSARYSLRYWNRKIWLIDKDEIIISIWKYLQSASVEEILALPEPRVGESIDQYNLTQEQRWLMGFIINRGVAQPRRTVTGFSNVHRSKLFIASQLDHIRHWKVTCGDYRLAENQVATWFIDPPYRERSDEYTHNSSGIDYGELAEWCRSRLGQVIVCESWPADWLPFQPIARHRTARSVIVESVWLSENQQLNLGF